MNLNNSKSKQLSGKNYLEQYSLCLKDLPLDITLSKIKDIMKNYGSIKSLYPIFTKFSNEKKFIVEYERQEEAIVAYSCLKTQKINGSPFTVEMQTPVITMSKARVFKFKEDNKEKEKVKFFTKKNLHPGVKEEEVEPLKKIWL